MSDLPENESKLQSASSILTTLIRFSGQLIPVAIIVGLGIDPPTENFALMMVLCVLFIPLYDGLWVLIDEVKKGNQK